MTKMRTAIAAGAVALAMTGCGADSGEIVSKREIPAHFITTTQCRKVGKTTTCTPVQQYVPECLEIRVDSGSDVDSECVDRATYDRVKVGDWWTAY